MESSTLAEVSVLFRQIVAALLTVVLVFFARHRVMTSVERLFGWPAPPPPKILTNGVKLELQDDTEVLLKCLETIAEENVALLPNSDEDEDGGWSTEDSDCVTVVEVPGLTTPHLLKRLTDDRNNNNNEWTKPVNGLPCHADAPTSNNKMGSHGDAQARRTNNKSEPTLKREEVRNRTPDNRQTNSSWKERSTTRQMQTTTSLTWPSAEGPLALRVHTTLSGNVRGNLEGRTEVLVDFRNKKEEDDVIAMNGDVQDHEDAGAKVNRSSSSPDEQLRRVDVPGNANGEQDRCANEESASCGITSDERLRGLLERASQRRNYGIDQLQTTEALRSFVSNLPTGRAVVDSQSISSRADEDEQATHVREETSTDRQVPTSGEGMPRAPKLDSPTAPRDGGDEVFSAHVTARAVAAEHPRNSSTEGHIRSVASARVSSRSEDNPILALACATAQATSAACTDASWELLKRRENATDISLLVSTACTVPLTGAWTARHRRSRSEPDLRRDLGHREASRSPPGIRQRHASSDYFRPPRHRNRPVPEFRDPAFRMREMKNFKGNVVPEPLPAEVKTVHIREMEAMPYPRSPIFTRTCDTLQLGPPPPRRSDRPSTPGSPPSILRTPSPLSSPSKTPEPPPVPPVPPKRNIKRSPRIYDPAPSSPRTYDPVPSPPRPSTTIYDPLPSPPLRYDPPPSPVTPLLFKVNGHHRASPSPTEDPEILTERITSYRTASRMTSKPPLPPQHHAAIRLNSGAKGRIANARRHYFDQQQQQQFGQAKGIPAADDRFETFCKRTQEERVRLASSPELAASESPPVRRRATIDRPDPPPSSRSRPPKPPSQQQPWPSELTRALLSQQQRRLSRSLGFLETNIDTLQSHTVYETDLDVMLTMTPETPPPPAVTIEDRARSVDYLLDEDRRADVVPPENRLGNGGRVKSEHELRVERSLQNLHIPEWYKKAELARRGKEGFLLSRRDSSSSQDRWSGLGSRTPSYSSLKEGGAHNVVIPKRVTRPYVSSLRSSRESLPSPGVESLSRWSSSRLSTSSAPVSTWTVYRGFQRPYLGWRAAAAATGQTPSPAPSTPLSLSRPVSPGRSPLSTHFHHPEPWSRPQVTQHLHQDEEPKKPMPTTPGRSSHHRQLHWSLDTRPNDEEDEDTVPKKPPEQSSTSEESQKVPNGQAVQIPRDRYSYLQSIYNSDQPQMEPEDPPPIPTESAVQPKSSPTSQVLWVESSFVGTRLTTSVAVMPEEDPDKRPQNGDVSPPPAPPSEKLGEYTSRELCRYGIAL